MKDVAQACILAAQVPVERLKQRVFNVTAGEQESYRDVAQRVRALFPQARLEIGSGTISVLDANARFDITAATEQLGYKPQFRLDEGLTSYADWLAEHSY
ncbi:hypothetical protein D9M71_786440 [compost metagenome]